MSTTVTADALIGVPTATLQQWLSEAQAAYHQLLTGGRAQVVTYGQGDGQKSVTYNRANAGQLLAWIQMLQQALGIGCGRRAIGVRFMR